MLIVSPPDNSYNYHSVKFYLDGIVQAVEADTFSPGKSGPNYSPYVFDLSFSNIPTPPPSPTATATQTKWLGDPNATLAERKAGTEGVSGLEVDMTFIGVQDFDGTNVDVYSYVIPTENHIDLNTGGAAYGYNGKYVTAAIGEGQTNLSGNDPAGVYSTWSYGTGSALPTTGYNAEDQSNSSGENTGNDSGRLVDAEGNLRTYSEVYVIPQGTPQADGTGGYVDPNTGGGGPGTLLGDGTSPDTYVTASPTEDTGVFTGKIMGTLPGGFTNSDNYANDAGFLPDGSSAGYASDGDSLGGMTYSVAYVIPAEEYGSDGTVLGFQNPDTGQNEDESGRFTTGGNTPGFLGTEVTGAPGGGNNTEGRNNNLTDATATGGAFASDDLTDTGDFSDVGYSETYAIPYEGYSDPNTPGNAPGYLGDTVGQGRMDAPNSGDGYTVDRLSLIHI